MVLEHPRSNAPRVNARDRSRLQTVLLASMVTWFASSCTMNSLRSPLDPYTTSMIAASSSLYFSRSLDSHRHSDINCALCISLVISQVGDKSHTQFSELAGKGHFDLLILSQTSRASHPSSSIFSTCQPVSTFSIPSTVAPAHSVATSRTNTHRGTIGVRASTWTPVSYPKLVVASEAVP
jgi:hypothetical protein